MIAIELKWVCPARSKKRDRQHDAELVGERREARDHRMTGELRGEIEVLAALCAAEVRRGEQLLQQHDLGALPSGGAHELGGDIDVRVAVVTAGHLRGRDRSRVS